MKGDEKTLPVNDDRKVITMETKAVFLIRNHHKCPSQLFLLHLNTYVIGLQPL